MLHFPNVVFHFGKLFPDFYCHQKPANANHHQLPNPQYGSFRYSDNTAGCSATDNRNTSRSAAMACWRFLGLALCKGLSFLQDVSTAVSILSLLAIAIDRYRGIVFPLRKQIVKTKLFKSIIPSIWIVSMVLHSFYFYTFKITLEDGKKMYCTPVWAPKFDEQSSAETQYVVLLVVFIVVPLCVVTFLYSVIMVNLKRGMARCKALPRSITARRLQEDAKVVKHVIAILIVFITCITPINVYAILFYFTWKVKIPCNAENFGFAAHFIFYSNASLNPCIYFIFNDKFRQGLFHIFPSKDKKNNLRQSVKLVRFKTFSILCTFVTNFKQKTEK